MILIMLVAGVGVGGMGTVGGEIISSESFFLKGEGRWFPRDGTTYTSNPIDRSFVLLSAASE